MVSLPLAFPCRSKHKPRAGSCWGTEGLSDAAGAADCGALLQELHFKPGSGSFLGLSMKTQMFTVLLYLSRNSLSLDTRVSGAKNPRR